MVNELKNKTIKNICESIMSLFIMTVVIYNFHLYSEKPEIYVVIIFLVYIIWFVNQLSYTNKLIKETLK